MNAADVFRWLGDLRESFRTQDDGERRAAELETLFLRRLTSAERVRRAWYQGSWRDALDGADRLLEEIDAGRPFHLEPALRIVRAHLRSVGGALDDATRDLDAALAAARRSQDPEALVPSLAAAARTAALAGDQATCLALFAELESSLQGGPSFIWGPALGDLALAAFACGRAAPTRSLLDGAPPTPWSTAARLLLDGDTAAAIDRYGAIGSAPDSENVRRLEAMGVGPTIDARR